MLIVRYIDALRHFVLIFCFVTRLHSLNWAQRASTTYESRRHAFVAYQYGISLNAGLAVLSLLEPLSENRDFGLLVVILDTMRLDVGLWLKLFGLFVLAVTLGFVGFEWAGAITLSEEVLALQASRPTEALGHDRWGAGTSFGFREAFDRFGPFDPMGFFGFLDEQKPLFSALFAALDPGMVPLDHYNIVADLLMWAWVFLSSVILVNLLIAMFSETCPQCKSNRGLGYE